MSILNSRIVPFLEWLMKKHYVYRSAVTGRFVSAAYAKRYPKRTIRQRIK